MRDKPENMQTLSGTVESIVFASGDTGFTVFELDCGGRLITVVGMLPGITAGEEVRLTGRYTTHPTYGQQFKAEVYERSLPATAAAILKYLSSGALRGVGPKTAQFIVDRFGDESLEVLEKRPEELAQIRGISRGKAAAIAGEYRQIFSIRSVMLTLSRYGIDPAAAIRIWKQWGPLTNEMLEQNPYSLCAENIGVSFELADSIAAQRGQDPAGANRLRAGIAHVLRHNLSNGHTCLPEQKLLQTAAGLLEAEVPLLREALEEGIAEGEFIPAEAGGARYVYLPEFYEAETYIAGRILMMLGTAPPPPDSAQKRECEAELEALEERLHIRYAEAQRRAIRMAAHSSVFILTGGPGTGKTTAMGGIISLLEARGEKVSLAAPTGRAAKRMSEVTGREASTIHRLLEVDFRDEFSDRIKFKRDEKNPLRAGTVILDEVSMADTRLLYSLMKALRLGCRLILVGDPDQLPSVGAGNILKDLLSSDVIPSVHLHEIFRQAAESLIVSNAHQIVRGELPDLSARDSDFFFLQKPDYAATARTVAELCTVRLPKAYGFSPMWDIQVITPSRIGALGSVELNRLLQQKLNPPDPERVEQRFGNVTFREQDKVMAVKNNYDVVWRREDGEQGAGVFNGDIGVIEMIDRPSQTILVRYDDRVAEYSFDMADELEHAWAITVHKSQGSEFEAVIMPLMSYHRKLYYRNILYTAVTRGRKLMILLGQPETVRQMVENDRKVLRYTNLARFLADGIRGEEAP